VALGIGGSIAATVGFVFLLGTVRRFSSGGARECDRVLGGHAVE
jgi:hypothetical protein